MKFRLNHVGKWEFIENVGLFVAGVAAFGVVTIFFGLFDVSALRGHLAITEPVLHQTYKNAVQLRAPPAAETPDDLSDHDRIELGARHYAQACETCHGAPGGAQTATARAMVPAPPPLREAVKDWEPRHLHWIVRNGVKMSGMPHWPAGKREDDVWHVVAFLEAAREMDDVTYREMVALTDGPYPRCAICHGGDGAGRGNAHVPRLDIQPPVVLAAALRAYRGDARQSGVMQHAASGLGEKTLEALAEYYATREAVMTQTPDPVLVARGEALAIGADPRVPSCAACHGPWPEPRAAIMPVLDGQNEAYLRAQLHLWRDGKRGGTERATLMQKAAASLTDAQIDALAAYYAAR